MHFHVFPHPTHRAGRQSALCLRCWRQPQVNVSGPKMLASVNGDRPLFGDAGADAVCALDFLGPHPAEPSSPILELACQRIFTTMRDCDARAITEQDGVASLTNHLIQFVYLLLGSEDKLIQRFAKMFQLSRRDDAWRLAIEWIEAVFSCRSLPGA